MTEPIAIIGIGMRLPGADNLDAFWAHLAAGRSLITEVSPRRWSAIEHRGNPSQENKTNSIWGGFLEDADAFDAAFFNVSPREASWMDPQQRFALEMAWHAIEDAGLRASALAGSRTGVYMGVCHWDYAELIEKHLVQLDAYTPTGIAFSIIANRVSHFFDLRGPSLVNDTACSASLVAVNDAVRALRSGVCDLALAGGVNLCWSPNHFISFAKSGMLSKDGRAKAFDARADGYVRGEGGGMLLLKPLTRARADGDPIHAVITGIATNHGGRTSSLTVTNPTAQAELIAGVHRDAGVSPDTVGYIEAHGPGTPLGDPIEIAGLKAAFRTRVEETGARVEAGSCGIGSVKTNIGHLEGAAGVAGIVKVVAALKHGALPPNVGFETLNPLIDLKASPFRIQSEKTPWQRTNGVPRRAGVSSFGFGGTNAHAVIEDVEFPDKCELVPAGLVVLPLSAKSDEALKLYAQTLIDFLIRTPEVEIAGLALTFQSGREAMDRRVAFAVEDRESLAAALDAYVRGVADPRVRLPGGPVAGADPLRAADLWVSGSDITLEAPAGARRVRAPLYPFQRERFWIDTALGAKNAQEVPHPFLHRNVSTFDTVAYRTRFTGSEFFLKEHRVNATSILPGVVALEMVRAAYADAEGPAKTLRLTDIVWKRAIAAGAQPVDVQIGLVRDQDGGLAFVISMPDGESPGPACVEGRLLEEGGARERLDIAGLEGQASAAVAVDLCYKRLAASGVSHGPAFRALANVRRGPGFVLANLRLPRRFQGSLAELPLHPVMLDAAIQAWVALEDETPAGAGIPFSCREVIIAGPCDAQMAAYVRPAAGARAAAGVMRLDIDLADREGNVRVAFRDLALRLKSEATKAVAHTANADDASALVLTRGAWSQATYLAFDMPGNRETAIFVCSETAKVAEHACAQKGVTVHTLPGFNNSDFAATAGKWFQAVHAHLARLIATQPKVDQKIIVAIPDALPAYVAAPAAGLLRTASLEHPRLTGSLVRIAGVADSERWRSIAAAEAAARDTFAEIRYTTDGKRLVWRPEPIETTSLGGISIARDGIYWITGGLGGLGLIFAEALSAQGARCVVLSGRSGTIDAAGHSRLETLRAGGTDVRVIACDVTQRAEVDKLVAAIAGIGPLKGVIHAAGVLDDDYIFSADPERNDAVLAPKIAGTLNIDAATADVDLSFMVLCSSIASAFGNAGQGAYAAANSFLDAFAEHREAQAAAGARRGMTRAIAWPLWADGGMSVKAPYVEALRARFGSEPLPAEKGIEVLWQVLSGVQSPRPGVLYGDRQRIGLLLANYGAEAETSAPEMLGAVRAEASPDEGLADRTADYLKELLAEATEIDVARIRASVPLAEYGLDSIIIVDVTAKLERVLGPLSKTLFFEHVTLASLARHLADEHGARLAQILPGAAAPAGPGTPSDTSGMASHAEARSEPLIPADDGHDIAIIGLSLRVAKAADKDAFWAMLAEGRHGVGPVPSERWDHSAIYHPERDVLGKTVVKSGAFLDGIDKFDPRYFRISQAEAELMSPEVRLFLEASVEAFEDAGYSREYMQTKFGGDVAVLVGSMTNEYDYFGLQNMLVRGAPASGSYTGTVPNMVSYFYGFTGPSYFLDTMCSAAATCIHEAVHMLRSNRCSMALAGGVSLLLHPHKMIAISQEHFTSKTAEVVRGYGLGADGTILGEGVGALVLKRRVDAERDGDHIYGIIKGTAVTNAGVRNGFTVPSPAQQAEAVSKAIADAGIDPRTINYVEGHGSGTALGDPIEIRGLTQAFRAHTADKQFCSLGTVKSNVAHLLAAAGLAGVAKVLMQLEHGQIAPSLNAEPPNPNIDFESTPFFVQRELAPWRPTIDNEGRELPRRAGVTSIGAGGMNSHIIIEEHVAAPRVLQPEGPDLIVLSAMNVGALQRLVERMRDHVTAHPDVSLADIAVTLQVGRTALPCRLAIVAASHDELTAKLDAFIASPEPRDNVWFTRSTLESDDRVDAAGLARAVSERALDRVAAAWTRGAAIDWDALHAGRKPRRVSLPTYPFERTRCWYPVFDDAPSVLQPLGARDVEPRTASTMASNTGAPASGVSASAASGAERALRQSVTALAAELLKFDVELLSPRASFYDLGFDSISLTRFASAISERHGVTISPAVFFECEHIDALCAHLARRGAMPAQMGSAQLALSPSPSKKLQKAVADGGRMRIAVVGLAVRLPGADKPDGFFDCLLAGKDLTSDFPYDRYGSAYSDRIRRAGFAKRGGFIPDVDRFDAALFRVSPVEARLMDPQQRLMLETAWRALESAGYQPQDLPRDTGVFVGVSGRDYASLLEAHHVTHDGFAATGNSLAMVANRISHFFDLNGASEAIDTACSSSLVALVRASEAIASGSVSMALVGGVNLALAVEGFEAPHLAGMLSPEGRCKTFSANADGYARGEGAIVLLLKPLAQAEADGDNILGVLIGGAVNHGGRAGALTAPNAKAQAALIERAMAGIDPATVGYIETHGTGTALGDPVEISGLRLAYERLNVSGRTLPAIGLGAVKSNIGHLEAAAGLAGVAKVLGALQRGVIPPAIHCREVNPHIELSGSPFEIVREQKSWPRPRDGANSELPRRAGVSSFGFGGVNAHVVLEEYPGGEDRRPSLPARPFAQTRFWIPETEEGAAAAGEVVLHVPKWREADIGEVAARAPLKRLILACGVKVRAVSGQRIIDCAVADVDIGVRYIGAAGAVLKAIQSELSVVEPAPVLVQLVYPLDGEDALLGGLGALLDTASAEAPHLIGQAVGVRNELSPSEVAELLEEEARVYCHRRIRRERERRLVLEWEELAPAINSAAVWRDDGVHIITGGMGGIGQLLAREIAQRVSNAVIVLVGRSPLDAERKQVLESLRQAGANARYQALDIADAAAVAGLVADVVNRHGRLNGVFHCAGALRDRSLLNKSRADLDAVLAPKVLGACALAKACQGLDLDHFVLFSSLAGAFGNAGQGDYAAANGFLDAFACKGKRGLPVLSVNWPLWRDGGMRVDAAGEAALFAQMGQRPLATELGLAALCAAQGAGEPQVAAVAGEGARIRTFFAEASKSRDPGRYVAAAAAAPVPVQDLRLLTQRMTEALRQMLARVSGMPAMQIDADTPLDEYGIDSLMITRLNRELASTFGTLSAALLFEHRTLRALAVNLAGRYPDACRHLTGEPIAQLGPSAPAEAGRIPSYALSKAIVASPAAREPIAIIGMSGRYPGAEDLNEFWENISKGRDLVGEVPAGRWPLEGFFEPDVEAAIARGQSYAKWGAFLDGFADFDPLLFKISPRDAAAMDPQERLFLMAAWSACEDAGYSRARLKARHDGKAGVYAGVTKKGFSLHPPFAGDGGALVRPSASFASVANRVSHVLDLNGPSVPIDTMCSSSLTAIHEACEALHAGTCTLALAGGVNLYLHPSEFQELSASRMLSPDGRCKSFGSGANGFVPGEGVGCIVLKPLSRALADGDRIHAVIRGTAVNHGGRTNGYTVPNPGAQRDVIRAALDRAGLTARDVTCIEAHGTGTDLGDPIEAAALTQAFELDTQDQGFCALGSIKSNLGHLEAAAGIAGLTKTVLQMKHGYIAPTLHASTPNPKLDLKNSPFRLATELAPWSGPRIAGVSSFGAGGANAHVIVEEWPSRSFSAPARANRLGESKRKHAIILSARDGERLRAAAERLLAFVERAGATADVPVGNDAALADTAALRGKLAALLGVAPEAIDNSECLDALGVDVVHRATLAAWLEAEFRVSEAYQVVRDARSVDQLAAMLAARTPQDTPAAPALRIADVAYTLQVGREAMDARLAFEAATLEELTASLGAFLGNNLEHPGLHHGNVRDHRAVFAALADDGEELLGLVRGWAERGDFGRLLSLWVQGLPVAWGELPGIEPAEIVSLPAYPFARQRYWLPERDQAVPRGKPPGEVLGSATRLPAPFGGTSEREALLAGVEILDNAIAPLVRAIVATLPDGQRLPPPFGRWLQALNHLVPSGRTLAIDDAWRAWDQFKQGAPPHLSSQIVLAETALHDLPDILTGHRSATAVLFPSGRLDLVEAVYKDNKIASGFSASLARTAADEIAARIAVHPDAQFRVLEIGAGTGGTSTHLFEALAKFGERLCEYRYTDVSRAFLIKAEQRFKEQVPPLATALFDVEKTPEEQGIAIGKYDIVVAANVLHATADISRTLRHVRATVAPGGVLLLNEVSVPTLFMHVTFGLLEGWWRATDAERRIPGSPLLSAKSWRSALEAAGFSWRSASPGEDARLGQQIIVAEALALASTNVAAERRTGDVSGGLRAALLRLVAATLNMPADQIAADRPFSDYGIDSILGAELVERLHRVLDVRIEQARLYDYTTVLQLERHIVHSFPDAASKLEKTELAAVMPHAVASKPAISVARAEPPVREPIAIIGYSGRFARSPDADALWEHLLAGHDLVEPVTRFPSAQGQHGSFIESFDCFDPVFFGISGLEATYMDPQQRLFLEESWKALEHAGHAGAGMHGRRCGVFAGCSAGDYQELFKSQPPGQAFWGNTASLIPARIAYFLDLKGPAVAVDTACSSSLVAIDLACQSLWSGECEMALAGGVFVQCTDRFFRYAHAAQMLSPAGRCAAFGENADGIVPGEAVAAVVLRPLSAALADGDTVHGLIVGTGTNQDGATNGITAPSALSQERLMRDVYAKFSIDVRSIGFVEAHGTGTRLGDPIEYNALAQVFSEGGAARGGCLLGSVKSNLGHATTAAGITSLIKVIAALKAGIVPPALHVGSGNPMISDGGGTFRINTTAEEWPAKPGPSRAAISSFGFSGTNAHVVVEEAPEQPVAADYATEHLVVLSARTADQLRLQAERLAAHVVSAKQSLTLRDVAFTLLTGRRHLPHRLALVARDLDDLAESLSRWLAGTRDGAVRVAVAGAGQSGAGRIPRGAPGSLAQSADEFLAGVVPDATLLFDSADRRRVPLPVYPLQRTRYWVKETAGAATAAAASPSIEPALSAVEQSRPSKVRLLDPEVAASWAAAPVSDARVALTSTAEAEPQVAILARVLRAIGADGVCKLMPAGPWNPALETKLADEIQAVSALTGVRAIVVAAPSDWNTSAAGTAARFTDAVLGCEVPVVMAVAHACRGAGLCAALASDFVVFARECQYGAKAADDPRGLMRRRLGDGLMRALAIEGREFSGAELVTGGLALPVLPQEQVEARALELAGSIAQAPRHVLIELKRHLRRDAFHLGGASPAVEPLRAIAGAGRSLHRGTPSRIPLASRAVILESYDDGVALLRMDERKGRNTFTPDLMDGLTSAFGIIAQTASFKAVILTGFESYFACGGTIEGLESLQRGDSLFTDRRIYSLPLECPLPVIAAMQGHAIGAGWALGMFCDVTLFGAESVYHSNYLELGFTPGAGATLIFPQKLGDDLGREVLFSAQPFKGRDLKARAPLLNVISAGDVLSEARRLAHGLALRSREELIAAKAEATKKVSDALPQTLARELDMHRRTFIGNDEALKRIRAAFPDASTESKALREGHAGHHLAQLRAAIVDSLAEELMISAADIQDGSAFLDLGLDSILAVTWIRRLNARFGIELPATAVYAQPTVGALVARIAGMVPQKVEPPDPAALAKVPQAPSLEHRDADAETREAVRVRVVASLAEELMISTGDIRDSAAFLDLGLDSILAVTWIRKLNGSFGAELPSTAVYAHPTVGALVDRLTRETPAVTQAPPAVGAERSSAQEIEMPKPAIAQARTVQHSSRAHPPIAVIGMSGRFPEAQDLGEFWDNIRGSRDCIREVPSGRWDIATGYDPDPQAPGKSYCKWMGAISGVDLFDPAFFNITPREAELMDPQQRLFLQHAWHAIEDAAIDPTSLAGTACGVFVGSGPSGYADLVKERNAYSLLGAAGSILAARIAYLLDLTGPAISLDTACSSSLVAMAEACNSLVLGDCDLAIAGGACVLIGPSMFVDTSKVNMLSKDGRCFTFDARANGFVPGEGVGVMVLKRLDDAVRDGDPVRAVIRGWGMNQDGKTNGIAAPNPEAQSRLVRGIHGRFSIAPQSIGLIECHGTGTALGDPIEIEGLAGAFAGRGMPEASVAIGSIKSNVGHLLAAAGVAGAMKAVLALEHAELPPTIHVQRPNPHLALSGTPFYINTGVRSWPAPSGGVRRAGVSAFGFSGTNAHIVFEEAPRRTDTRTAGGSHVLPLSARTPDQLSAYAAKLKRFVASQSEADLAALAATFQTGRTAFAIRHAIVFHDRSALIEALESLADGAHVPFPAGNGPMETLARRWSAGEHVEWPAPAAQRIQAPGYPFAEERCWVESDAGAELAGQLRARISAPVANESRVAIIGGGPTGIGIGRELNDAGILFDLFEAESDFGGVWNSNADCGRTYSSLHLISPKFNTQVQDFPMPDDYPAYPSHAQMLAYIRDYARVSGLYERARFGAPVTRLTPKGRGWQLESGDGFTARYDLVVVANGLQRRPLYPEPAYPGRFDGETLHTRYYKSPDQIRGRRVLIIGGGNSGCDIAAEAVHHAASVVHSTRRGYHYQPKFIAGKPTPQWMMELGGKFATKTETMAYIEEVFRLAGYDGTAYGLPSPDHPLDGAHPVMNTQILYHIGHGDIRPKNDIERFEGKTVHFLDGSTEDVDLIIYATGYRRDFPFLDKSLLQWKDGIPDLFLHAVPRNHDNLLFMGFVNAAGGLGDGLKTQGLFVRDYARAFAGRTRGIEAFLHAKQIDSPDLGQDQFVRSYRHLWEADLWKLLAEMRRYRDMLADESAGRMEAAQ